MKFCISNIMPVVCTALLETELEIITVNFFHRQFC